MPNIHIKHMRYDEFADTVKPGTKIILWHTYRLLLLGETLVITGQRLCPDYCHSLNGCKLFVTGTILQETLVRFNFLIW